MKGLIITILLIASSMVLASAQTPQYYWSNYAGTGITSGIGWNVAPYAYAKVQCVYYPTNFPTAPSGNISSVYVRVGIPPNPKSTYSVYTNFSVRMGWSRDSVFNPISLPSSNPDSFAFFKGLTTVFSSPSFVINGVDTPGKWVKMPLIPNSFYYNKNRNATEGKYLVVEFRLDGPSAEHGFYAMVTVVPGTKRILSDYVSKTISTNSYKSPIDFGFDIGTPVGIDDALISSSLSIFPNPSADGRFQISFGAKQSMKDVNITVRSMTGTVVYNQHYSSASTQFNEDLNIGNNARGMYFVEILADGERVVRKIVIQ
jgi:hypothetical protein